MNRITQPDNPHRRLRLVVSDMDGTLLNENKEISHRTLAAIAALRECGILFTVCTGREYAMLEHYARQIQPTAPMICNNGGEVIRYPQGEVICRRLMPKPETLSLVKLCFAEGIDFCVTTPEGAYFPAGSSMTGFYREHQQKMRQEGLRGFPVRYISSQQELSGLPLNKMIFRTDLTATEKAVRYIRQELTVFDTTMSSEFILEVIPCGMNKAQGLKRLCEYLGITPAECCAVGDYENDTELLKLAGLSVAMENGQPAVKSIADFVTASNDREGVALLLEQLVKEYAPIRE